MSNVTSQVFYDPRGRRWRRFKASAQLGALALSVVFGVLGVTVASDPALYQHSLSSLKVHSKYRYNPSTLGLQVRPLQAEPEARLPVSYLRRNPALPTGGSVGGPEWARVGEGERIGFFVDWDASSLASLKHNLSRLDKLIPEWLHATKANGEIVSDTSGIQRVLAYVRQHPSPLAIVPLVNNYNVKTERWETIGLSRMLADPQARTRAIEDLLHAVRQIDGAGICVAFEGIPLSDLNLATFMAELAARFHLFGLEVAHRVPLDDPFADYRALGSVSDYLILSAYDEHTADDQAGPVAAQDWYVDALQRRFAELEPAKYVIAIGNYGYDWTGNATPAIELPVQEAINIARDSGGGISFDAHTLNPTFQYSGDAQQVHRVWFLDAVTAFNQLAEGQRYGPRGFALWRLGTEDPSVWRIFGRAAPLDEQGAKTLEVLPAGDLVDDAGRGEILKVMGEPRSGTRAISYNDKFGLILDERFTTYSSGYMTTRWGGDHEDRIALTFDDGPDAMFTPAVLDILARYHVPATFFVVGRRAMRHADLIHRIIDEGHEIGNHTFTHPNITAISQHQLGVELNATERFLESTLGRRFLLFRPPYGIDISPETPEQLKPLVFASRLGYYVVDAAIDTSDWQRPGVGRIVQTVVDSAVRHEGNVVVLHDGGGDRSETVSALPRIIEELQGRGFQLVPVSDLLGLTRDAVMPPIPPSGVALLSINHAAFWLLDWFERGMHVLFVIGLVLGVPRPLVLGILALVQRRRRRRLRPVPPVGSFPSVGIVVPAYNEAKVIGKTIQALLRSSYQTFDIIVVDDGSTDGTYAQVVGAYGDHPRVRAFTQPNGGKGQALNFGIAQTRADVIVTLDADTIVRANTIEKLVRHFADPSVGAVAGNAKVGNRAILLARWQALEYITTQNLERRAFDVLNCITVVPGAVGAWRRAVVLQARGFATETIAEDADLTFAILRMGYRVVYEEDAIGLTEAPETLRSFLKQRFRWMYGTLQTVWKHRDTMFRRRSGALGMVAVPYVLVFQIFFSIVAPIVDLFIILTIAALLWQRSQHPLSYSNEGLMQVLGYFVLFQGVEFLSSLLAFALEPEDSRLLLWVFVQRFFYRLVLYYVGIKTIVAAIKGRIVGWSKFERKASVLVRTA